MERPSLRKTRTSATAAPAKTSKTTGAGTGGGTTEQQGINGSTVALPFGLDPAKTPVLGSYQDSGQQQTQLTTQWYRLDLTDSMRHDPAYQVLAITAAGRRRLAKGQKAWELNVTAMMRVLRAQGESR